MKGRAVQQTDVLPPPEPVVGRSSKDATEAEAGKTPIVIVLGMHRSGTSLCAHLLKELGVDMADTAGRGPGNDEGHWERWELVSFHDRILTMLGRAWGAVGEYMPSHDLPLPEGWWADPRVVEVRREIEKFLRSRMRPNQMFGFKDPRTLRLMPMWSQILQDLSLSPRIILCLRKPRQVAQSLQKRDAIPLEVGEYRWLIYNTEFFKRIEGSYLTIDYDDWFEAPRDTLDRLIEFVEPPNAREIDAGSDVLRLVKGELNHNGADAVVAGSEPIRRFYGLVRGAQTSPGMRSAIGSFVDHFTAFEQVVPIEAALRQQQSLAADADGLRRLAQEKEILTAEVQVAREQAASAIDQAASAATASAARLEQLERAAAESERSRQNAVIESRDAIETLQAARIGWQHDLDAARMRAEAAEDRAAKLAAQLSALAQDHRLAAQASEVDKERAKQDLDALTAEIVVARKTSRLAAAEAEALASGSRWRLDRMVWPVSRLVSSWHRRRQGYGDNPHFDKTYYLERNKDVRWSGWDPYSHYVIIGAREGRNPSAAFDTEGYLESHPDVQATGLNPLAHFLQHGPADRTAGSTRRGPDAGG